MRRSGSGNRRKVPDRAGAERSGRRAERLAAWFLRLQGYRIIAARFRSSFGEIDLVAQRRDLILFVEVKQRRGVDRMADALAAVNRRRIVGAARHFMATHPEIANKNFRFDVIFLAPFRFPAHFKGAFDASGQG